MFLTLVQKVCFAWMPGVLCHLHGHTEQKGAARCRADATATSGLVLLASFCGNEQDGGCSSPLFPVRVDKSVHFLAWTEEEVRRPGAGFCLLYSFKIRCTASSVFVFLCSLEVLHASHDTQEGNCVAFFLLSGGQKDAAVCVESRRWWDCRLRTGLVNERQIPIHSLLT